jgi:3'-5' exonuclease
MSALTGVDIEKILFLDIETVPAYPEFSDMPEHWQDLWSEKTKWQRGEEKTAEEYYPERAGIMAEFGKIICISVGFIKGKEEELTFRVRSFFGEDEKVLLEEFAALLNKFFSSPSHYLAAHNGKEFDFPYIARRMVVNRISIPNLLDTAGKKPWEVTHIDTMELWKFGDRKNFSSLKLLAALLDIPTPKDDMDGSMVGPVYWKEKDLDRIRIYCQKDTLAVAQLLLRFTGGPLIEPEQVVEA